MKTLRLHIQVSFAVEALLVDGVGRADLAGKEEKAVVFDGEDGADDGVGGEVLNLLLVPVRQNLKPRITSDVTQPARFG